VIENRSIFAEAIYEQTAELREIHQKEAEAAALRLKDVESSLLVTIEDLNQLQSMNMRLPDRRYSEWHVMQQICEHIWAKVQMRSRMSSKQLGRRKEPRKKFD
jgi:hypothetical protein